MTINIPENFKLSPEQITALEKEAKRIAAEIGNRRCDFTVSGISGHAVNGVMEVTSGPIAPAKAVAPKQEVKKPQGETVTNAPASGKVTTKAAAKKK